MASKDLAQIAFEASLRSLDKQERLLEELRALTGMLFAASALAASFVGEGALAGPLFLAGPALAAFSVSIGASLYILVPQSDVVLALAGSPLYARLHDSRHDVADAYRKLAYELDGFWVSNDAVIKRLHRVFRLGTLALALEILLLLASAGVSLG